MLVQIAWRNVWRNKLRSSVVIIAIAIGLWAGTFIMGYAWGMKEQRVQQAIQNKTSHLQMHHPDFQEKKIVKHTIPEGEQKIQAIRKRKEVSAIGGRSITQGMLTTTTGGTGVLINGIIPEAEQQLIQLKDKLTKGKYLKGVSRNPVLVGQALAEEFNLQLNSRLVLNFQDKEGQVTAASFRVAGIYSTNNTQFEKRQLFVKANTLNKLLGLQEGAMHEIAILLKDNNKLEMVSKALNQAYPDMLVETWKQLSPQLRMIVQSMGQMMYVFIGIILLALAFGIVNTMLMAVMERTRELGMLMAIGMNKIRVFFMITLETCFLTLVGAPVGLLLAWCTIYYTGQVGIDLSAFAQGLKAYGFSTIIYPQLTGQAYGIITAMVIGVALLSALYPAIRALRLEPAKAVRKV